MTDRKVIEQEALGELYQRTGLFIPRLLAQLSGAASLIENADVYEGSPPLHDAANLIETARVDLEELADLIEQATTSQTPTREST